MSVSQQIAVRMKAKNISITSLEREAGLKTHSVRNILRGKSKRPSAEILQAVADVLGCSVRDLLTGQGLFHGEKGEASQKVLLDTPYIHKQVFYDTVQILNQKIDEKHLSLSVKQFLTCVEEIYLHALQSKEPAVDQVFVDWFIDLMGN